jgi:2-dehydro-3-deoxyphosphogluconate aldolase/(4S)-4-hydroxy-2-oxoglutarate aldolase
MDIKRFKKFPLLGILRGIEPDILEPLVDSVVSSGLKTIEITMNTAGAAGLIKQAIKYSRGHLAIGAGTVLNTESLRKAIDAGATFMVMPVLLQEVAAYCVKNNIPFFPGALTPQEIYSAWNSGAAMVKVFPSGFFGPAYFKEIKGPFNNIELLACGGVKVENMANFFSSGVSAIAFGNSVFRKEWLARKDFAKISQAIKNFVAKWQSIATE